MPNEMGELTGRMVGRVIRGEDIERVLAQVPEQAWGYDDEVMVALSNGRYEPLPVSLAIPMARRREIVSHILCALPD